MVLVWVGKVPMIKIWPLCRIHWLNRVGIEVGDERKSEFEDNITLRELPKSSGQEIRTFVDMTAIKIESKLKMQILTQESEMNPKRSMLRGRYGYKASFISTLNWPHISRP